MELRQWFNYMFQSTYLYKVRPRPIFLTTVAVCFNPRTYIRYDFTQIKGLDKETKFQSTYLYKVRLQMVIRPIGITPGFNPRTYIRYDFCQWSKPTILRRFNPRTYIRYDGDSVVSCFLGGTFQSTYLYKVRQPKREGKGTAPEFQSTYLYKVRLHYK